MPPPSPTAPGERNPALDTVRGLAVLGILVMNVVEFGLPLRAYTDPTAAGGSTGADLVMWLAQETLFDGRMRALFSLLFGAGMVLMADRMAAMGRGGEAADLLLRRCLWLIPFGLVHRFLLQWTGDILYMYGLFGVLAVGLRNLRPRTQIVAGLLALAAFVPIEWRKFAAADELRQDATAAAELRAAGAPVPDDTAAAEKRWLRRAEPPAANAHAAEIAAMRGGWLDVFRYRWDYHHTFQADYVYYHFVWDVLGMLLLGMGLARTGFLTGRSPSWLYAAAVAAGACAAGVSWALADAWADSGWSRTALELTFWKNVAYPFCRLVHALGWAGLLILLLRRRALPAATNALADVGRMAFSNYVLQTLLATTFFFGWGLGMYGELSRSGLMLFVLGASVVQIVWSRWWLRRFRSGPLEWAWRSLTYWHRQPLRSAD